MKNELNAALHFIKFVKRVKNLAANDPALHVSLENAKDVLTTFQVCYLLCPLSVIACLSVTVKRVQNER